MKRAPEKRVGETAVKVRERIIERRPAGVGEAGAAIEVSGKSLRLSACLHFLQSGKCNRAKTKARPTPPTAATTTTQTTATTTPTTITTTATITTKRQCIQAIAKLFSLNKLPRG